MTLSDGPLLDGEGKVVAYWGSFGQNGVRRSYDSTANHIVIN